MIQVDEDDPLYEAPPPPPPPPPDPRLQITPDDNTLVQEIKSRFTKNKNGRLNSLLYIRLTTAAGVEKSGHIDLADRAINQGVSVLENLQPGMQDLTYKCN